jgi:hypothetical protein
MINIKIAGFILDCKRFVNTLCGILMLVIDVFNYFIARFVEGSAFKSIFTLKESVS